MTEDGRVVPAPPGNASGPWTGYATALARSDEFLAHLHPVAAARLRDR